MGAVPASIIAYDSWVRAGFLRPFCLLNQIICKKLVSYTAV